MTKFRQRCFNLLWAVFCMSCAVALVVVIGFSTGAAVYHIEKNAQCINSACAGPCKPSARFVRHAGCLK